ncbi:MAG: L,D-transpeptidase [Chitinophagaceae bacterium]|nr:L,D-transpeptidase [Chitinophagaceae bacterium]
MKNLKLTLITLAAAMALLTGFSFMNRSKKFNLHKITKAQPLYKVVIYKSKYELQLFDEEGWYATYPVVFGTSEMKDKMMEGDKQTPEGHFKIVAKKIHAEWGPFLLLDYPNQESLEKFNARKNSGEIPYTAKPGGGIGIHATRNTKEDRFVDYYYNWTLGCISTKREYAKELYNLLPIGTEVTIYH